MTGWMVALWLGVIAQRLFELQLADKNARWMKKQGGYEAGREHYLLIVVLHVLFFAGIWLEKWGLNAAYPGWWPIPLLLFLLAQSLRIWCIRSLGRYWNTRIWIVPGHSLQVRGPYKYLRHPNYGVVMLEMLLFPLIFGAYYTAVIGSILNALLLLFVRIPAEERALMEAMNYNEEMGEKRRFFPSLERL
ncbi:isoprenylcysteine carboxyl methyltransferase family protein [Paenactinomyces guangxiensis]|uniref:Protein-S-isoprenylcysteine O-methyltransferase n=1 Tax=Paenactinomyces guangxiensis TaxID=1490290 RepID=A0A7W2A6R3_9BACL|nr:isoprenylcysteine carboxylmethyltransferase family protein [Paenactinomyces guangxiensis]MBA4493681.1 hypothetical protein [Paenactinomyces guangxiensis]MBH8590968.1 hypothetical protein [Paenactinomyces guangxiensis]